MASCISSGRIRSFNKEGLMMVQPGMTVREVVKIMGGVEAMPNEFGRISDNPYKRELFDTGDELIEVIWYYTDHIVADGVVNMNELTPITFSNDQVVAVGWKFYEEFLTAKNLNPHLRTDQKIEESDF